MFTHRPARPAALPAAFLLLTSGLVVAAPPTPASAATIVYVNAGASGSGSGTSWTNAYTSLADALSATPSGSEIWVAAGRYTPTDGTDRTATFQLTDGVAVYGGFAGGETQRDQRDWQANVTTLSGDLNGDDGANFTNNGENSYHVVTGATGATLDGVTVTGGNATHDRTLFSTDPDNYGGGIDNTDSSPALAHVTVHGNYAFIGAGMSNVNSSPSLTDVTLSGNQAYLGYGGGMYNGGGSSPTLTDVAISGNFAWQYGGGMYDDTSSPALTRVTVDGNSAGDGGGVFNANNSTVTLSDVTFDGNFTDCRTKCGWSGGGLYNANSTATLTDVTFTGNAATAGQGGGLLNGGSATLTRVTFIGNTAHNGGGGMDTGGNSSPTLTDVVFSGNSATNNGSWGGGMYIESGDPTLTNVLLSGNSATNGGGMATGHSNATLTNVTISGNAAANGGGMWNTNDSHPQVRNAILWGNGSSNVYNYNPFNTSSPGFSSSLVEGSGGSGAWNSSFGTDGGSNLDADPQFVTPVPTPAPSSGGDLHLGTGSPAIDTGDNGFLPVGLVTDLDGNPRIFGGTVDMGAYEAQDTTPPDTTIDSTPPDPSTSADAAFTFSGTDDRTPAAGLTFECSLDGAGFASCSSPTSYTALASGSHTFEVRATDGAGNVDPTPASYSWAIQSQAPTTLLYNGDQIVNVGSGLIPGSLLSSSAAACSSGQTVGFSLDADPVTGASGEYALGTATTSSSGQATLPTITTNGWQEGTYLLTTTFVGTATCLASSDTATLTVASPGAAASGGGWYTLSGSGRSNFGFTVRKTSTTCTSSCAYKGQLVLVNNGKWRVKGNLTTYSKTSGGQGAASGTGNLYWWDASLDDGAGDWVLAASGVTYTINVSDGGKPSKSSSDTFGIRIVYTPVTPQPSTLPNSTPQPLKGGDIRLS
jgi:hypothetical protein